MSRRGVVLCRLRFRAIFTAAPGTGKKPVPSNMRTRSVGRYRAPVVASMGGCPPGNQSWWWSAPVAERPAGESLPFPLLARMETKPSMGEPKCRMAPLEADVCLSNLDINRWSRIPPTARTPSTIRTSRTIQGMTNMMMICPSPTTMRIRRRTLGGCDGPALGSWGGEIRTGASMKSPRSAAARPGWVAAAACAKPPDTPDACPGLPEGG